MKKILLFTLSLAFYGIAVAQLKLTENFGAWSGTSPQNLGITNGWTLSGTGTTDAQVYVSATNTGALTYPNYTAGQNYLQLGKVNGTEKYKVFGGGGAVSTTSSSTFFISFLVRMNSATTNVNSSSAAYSLSLHNTTSGNTSYPSRFFIRIDNNDNVEFGISKASSAATQNTNNDYNRNGTYLIVIRYDVATGTSNDGMWLWVNPSLTSEPSTASADLSISGGTDPGYSTQIDALMLHQSSSTNSPIADFDAFRVSNRPTSDIAWTDLGAQGAPLPVKFGNIKGYEKSAGVQIDWTAYSEENVAEYIVERSADGQHFTEVGTVAARNNASEIQYGFFDANPLAGYNFYRLRNMDIDGKNGFSNIVRVDLTKGGKDITVYPNPVRGGGIISYGSSQLAKGNYTVRIINAGGQQVFTQRFSHTGGAINQSVQLPVSLNSGFYTLLLESEGVKAAAKTFMVQ